MATIQTSIRLNDRISSALRSMSKSLNLLISDFNGVDKATNKATTAQNRLNNSMRQGTGIANGLWGKVKAIGAAYAGWQTVKMAVGASDKYANNTARLGLISGGDKQTAELQQKIYEASQRSLTNYNAMTDAVAKLGITAKNAFSSNDEIVQFTELLNKQFKIAGTGAQEQSAAMYQLTQAMAAGKLQGDEFRSILENAPMLAQAIANEMGVGADKLKEMSSQGKITADVIKSALFNSAEEVNAAYKKLPMTFGGIWTQVLNKVNKGCEGLYKRLGQIWNNPAVQTFIDSLVNGFIMVINVVVELFNVFAKVFSFIYQNWNIIEPILIGLAVAFLPTIISLLWAKVVALWAAVKPILVQAAAWLAVNWPILLVAAAIAGLIWLINYFGITGQQVCGAVCGAVMWLGAVIWNIIKFIGNIVSGVCQFFVNSWLWVADNFGTICSNIGIFFSNLWQSATIKFYQFLDAVLSGLEWLATPIKALAKLFGMDLGGAFDNMHTGINNKIKEAESKKQKYGKLKEFQPIEWETFKYTNLDSAYNKGYKWGSNAAGKVGDFVSGIKDKFGFGGSDALTSGLTGTNGLGSIGNALKDANSPLLDELKGINSNTAKTSGNTAKSNVDMSYLRELAEREAINSVSNSNVKVDMTNNNSINSMLDIDSVIDVFYKRVSNAMNTSAEGVHI